MMIDILIATEHGDICISPLKFFMSENFNLRNLYRIAKMISYSDGKTGDNYAKEAWTEAAKEHIETLKKMLYTEEDLTGWSKSVIRQRKAKNRETQKKIDDLQKFIKRLEESK